MVDLLKDAKYIKGVGPNRVKQLNKLGIYNLEDLNEYYKKMQVSLRILKKYYNEDVTLKDKYK